VPTFIAIRTAALLHTDGAFRMIVANTDATAQARIPLGHGARRLNLTPHGLLKILQRTNSAIRDDGRWYVAAATLDQIETARRVLGIDPEARNSLSRPA
jgi:hypothetical protein